MLTGTEADIINSVARLREATKDQIRREVGFSLEYIGFLCQYLVRRGYLTFAKGHYSLAKGIKTPLSEQTPKIDHAPARRNGVDRKLLKEVAGEIAEEISGERCGIKIKTDFDFPVEDESLDLESNINKIGPNLKKEKSDIDESVKLFKEIQKGGVDG